ncbi:MAG: fibronectin/fibrinogen-binding protein [Lachnospiraceae bacterium]|nr:fibronectin/fibrinogen-binding protein [Lachnospiraceae bacterium]
MAFDGITICNLVHELRENIENGRINKIAQPETDALMLTIKGPNGNRKLFLSASASLPLIYFTEKNKQNPMTAPNFCMLLRKHLSSARIIKIYQPDFERIIVFEIEHRNELGDLCLKKLIVEIMGKHSNIIFTDDKDMIIDSIKHIPASVSSVREVLPGRHYFIPKTTKKANPIYTTLQEFENLVFEKAMPLAKAIYQSYTGISPVAAQEICYRASLDGDRPVQTLDANAKMHLFHTFELFMDDIRQENFSPMIIYNQKEPKEYTVFPYEQFRDYQALSVDSISLALETFYQDKEIYSRIHQKSADLRRIVTSALERNRKKYDLQLHQLADTEGKDKYKLYGELLHTYGYSAVPGDKSITCLNYYTNEDITIPLDETKTAMENATRYFEKYNKLKRTKEALEELIVETKQEIEHLDAVLTSIDISTTEEDLKQIREELIISGEMKERGKETKKTKSKSKPFHYRTADGYDIYVGKNNLQNDELTFKFANGNDWWFHAKKMPGSHVVVKSKGDELPDHVFEDAARLAAYYSKGRGSQKVEIDYVRRKEVKKPGGSKPGFVVYYTNYSMTSDDDISQLTLLDD